MPKAPDSQVEEKIEGQEAVAEKEQTAAAESTQAAAGQAAAEPEYTPNWKFKVLDQEKEFDEWIRPAVNKDNEAKIRELYEKAHGLDHVKSKASQERQVREELEATVGQMQSTIREIMAYREKDLGRFFKEVGLDKQRVAQWLLNQHETEEHLKDLPEPLRKMYSEHEALKTELEGLRRQNEELSTSGIGAAVQARTTELQSTLSQPEIKTIVEAFDSRLGKPGAFQDMVIRHGRSEWEASQGKRDLSAGEAVKEVLNILGLQTQPAATTGTPNGSSTQQQKVVTQAKPTVLPNVGAGGNSATGKRPSSLDDLRAMARELQG